ncbi:YqcC family protein [Vibrio sp. WXL103]|uniref:YqcC family protein n=1 Tax=Vibrio sp. WXL103 TaxID=3450710 RepID=UPI003EC812D0
MEGCVPEIIDECERFIDITVNKDIEITNMSILKIFGRKLTEKDKRVIASIDEIESEMKSIGYWNDNPPKISVSNYLEAPSFELWLQCVLIPNARDAAKSGEYPDVSQVGEMASRQYNYHSYVEEAQNLLGLLHQFDRAVLDR